MNTFVAEAVGIAILVVLGCGCVANVLLDKCKGSMGGLSSGSGWLVIAWGWGFAVTFGVYAVAWASGAHINPAVTIAMAILGKTPWSQVPIYMGGQLFGAIIGAVVVWLAYLPHWEATKDPGLKLAVFSTGPAIRNLPANTLCEAIGTFMLVLGILALIDPNVGKATPIGGLTPLVIGFLVTAIGISLGGPTGFAINPARDLGPRIAHALLPIAGKGGSDWGYSWVPVVGGLIGGAFAAVVYRILWL
jgi:glycerol uptake facilitator protein